MTQQQLDKRVILVGDINIPHQPIDLGPGLLKLGARGGYSQEEVEYATHPVLRSRMRLLEALAPHSPPLKSHVVN